MMSPGSSRRLLLWRCGIALAQAALLYLLVNSTIEPRWWPAPNELLLVPFLFVVGLVPILLLLGIGQVRARPLLAWALAAAIMIAGLSYHNIARGHSLLTPLPAALGGGIIGLQVPLLMALFIGHTLVADAVRERRFFPSYARHFDTAWKLALQIKLTAVFVGVFWLTLFLGGQLFKLLGADFFLRFIVHLWFAFPVTTLAIAAAIHATDVQPVLIRGTRTLVLGLFSWLLPVLAIIILGFLIGLLVLSPQALWNTHFAGSLLLWTSVALIVLINCCYQDGSRDQTKSTLKRVAASLAALELVPLVGLAAWAVWLHAGPYGWTTQRITAAATTCVLGCYAIGYASAVFSRRDWLQRIESANVVGAYLYIAVFLFLFSPLGDPAKLMVADQLARLQAGTVDAEHFDFVALRLYGAHWGDDALHALADSASKDVADRARNVLAAKNPYDVFTANQTVTDELAKQRILVYPAGHAVPPALTDGSLWPLNGSESLFCFKPRADKCVVRFMTFPQQTRESMLLLNSNALQVFVLDQDDHGDWHRAGSFNIPFKCTAIDKALADDPLTFLPHRWPDLVIAGQRLEVHDASPVPCPSK